MHRVEEVAMKEMHRREFLRKVMRSTPVVAGAAAVAAGVAKAQSVADPAVDSVRQGIESLQSRIREMDDRIDALEDRQKKWVRVAVGAAALSLGIDIGAIL